MTERMTVEQYRSGQGRACVECGQAMPHKRVNKYCSTECKKISLDRQRPAPTRMAKSTCLQCGTVNRKPLSDIERGFGSFCNRDCYVLYRSRHAEMFNHKRSNGGKREDLGIFVRSTWEANWARYLNWLVTQKEIQSWEYEAETFEFPVKRGSRFYTPDFKIINSNGSIVYHEVKGYLDQRGATKLKRMAKYYPDKQIIVIRAEEYRAVATQMSRIIEHWESGRYDKPLTGRSRSTLKISWRGQAMSIMQAAKLEGISPGTVYHRIGKGWSVSDALTVPPKK